VQHGQTHLAIGLDHKRRDISPIACFGRPEPQRTGVEGIGPPKGTIPLLVHLGKDVRLVDPHENHTRVRRHQRIDFPDRQANPGVKRLDARLDLTAAGNVGKDVLPQNEAHCRPERLPPLGPDHRRRPVEQAVVGPATAVVGGHLVGTAPPAVRVLALFRRHDRQLSSEPLPGSKGCDVRLGYRVGHDHAVVVHVESEKVVLPPDRRIDVLHRRPPG